MALPKEGLVTVEHVLVLPVRHYNAVSIEEDSLSSLEGGVYGVHPVYTLSKEVSCMCS